MAGTSSSAYRPIEAPPAAAWMHLTHTAHEKFDSRGSMVTRVLLNNSASPGGGGLTPPPPPPPAGTVA